MQKISAKQKTESLTFISDVPKSVMEYYKPFRKNIKKKRRIIDGVKFEIDENYTIVDNIGKGAYGMVCKAVDKNNPDPEEYIAIKKIEKAFDHKIFAKRTLRELKILRLLNHPNIMKASYILLPKSREEFDDIYMVCDLMETDLHQVLKSPIPVTNEHIMFFMYQILMSLKYIHSAGVIHRDLKPKNILVNSNCDVKLCDFGLARITIPYTGAQLQMTDYVTTRWYRAPELLLACEAHSNAVDIWATGCILAEMLKRKPLLTGSTTKNQIEMIINLIGTPDPKDLEYIDSDPARKFLDKLPRTEAKDLLELFPDANPLVLDLLTKMLQFNPIKRITADQALKHPYFVDLHSPEDEISTKPINIMEFEFELKKLTKAQYKDLLYEEILLYNFPDFKKEYFAKIASNKSTIEHILINENSTIVDTEDSEDEPDEL